MKKSLSSTFVLHALNTLGYKASPPVPERTFDQWSLFYLISGEVLMESESDSYLIRGHEFVLVPPGVPFKVSWYRDSIGYMGGFDENILKDRSFVCLQAVRPLRISVRADDEGFVDELMYKLLRKKDDLRVVASCLDVMLQQIDADTPENRMPDKPLVNQFLDRIFDREKTILSVSGYAELFNVTPNYLNRIVHKGTGRSAGEWIDISRLTYAKILLHRKDLAIIDIASMVGLPDQSYFSRFFKKMEGITPTEFRKGL